MDVSLRPGRARYCLEMIPAALSISPLFYLIHFHLLFFGEWPGGRRALGELPTSWKAYARRQFSAYRLSSVVLACIALAVMLDAFEVY